MSNEIEMAEKLALAPLAGKSYFRQPGNVLAAGLLAQSLGLPFIQGLYRIHVIDGKPTMSAELMVDFARKAGHKIRIVSEPDRAIVSIWRKDDPDYENRIEWNLQMAKAAGLLGKDSWQKYPRAMLRSRAISECVRMAASEVLGGVIYDPEELEAPNVPVKAVISVPLPAPEAEIVEHSVDAVDADIVSESPVDGMARNQVVTAIMEEAAVEISRGRLREIWMDAKVAGASRDDLDEIAELAKYAEGE